jgi:hypothetical protein
MFACKVNSRGIEFIREGGVSNDTNASDVLASSRINSLPQGQCGSNRCISVSTTHTKKRPEPVGAFFYSSVA